MCLGTWGKNLFFASSSYPVCGYCALDSAAVFTLPSSLGILCRWHPLLRAYVNEFKTFSDNVRICNLFLKYAETLSYKVALNHCWGYSLDKPFGAFFLTYDRRDSAFLTIAEVRLVVCGIILIRKWLDCTFFCLFYLIQGRTGLLCSNRITSDKGT